MRANNPYPGINAHLNSTLQADGGWESFHAAHIVHLSDALNDWLPAGYYAQPETSLQISGYITPDKAVPPSRMKPDVTICQSGGGAGESSEARAAPTLVLPLSTVYDTEKTLSSVVISEAETDQPVTQIELLLPANKAGGSYYRQYMEKRTQVLQTDLHLVEIDYLHRQAPLLSAIPDYTACTDEAAPYMILVSSRQRGQVAVYSIGVLDALPTIALPLAASDTVATDFGAVYNTTFARLPRYHTRLDYPNDPAGYCAADQAEIRAYLRR